MKFDTKNPESRCQCSSKLIHNITSQFFSLRNANDLQLSAARVDDLFVGHLSELQLINTTAVLRAFKQLPKSLNDH
jgi:hypothetical protein